LGPRQVGKSTLLAELLPELVINLADESTYRDHLKDPALIRKQVEALSKGIILVDEIQRLPSLLNTIQALIDEKKSRKFILTGSNARKLKKGHTNLLPGRIFSYRLFPFVWWEIKQNFNLDRALTLGTLPEIYLEDYGVELIKNYIDTYLREEIMQEALVRGVDQFARFLDLSAECSGKEINYSKLSSQSEIPKETLRRFYEILNDTLIVYKLKGYTESDSTRKAVQKEKMIYFDLGVKNAIQRKHKNVFSDTEKGELFEQWVINQLVAFSSYHNLDWDFYYYRDGFDREIDLIIDTGKKIMAIEIKYSTKTKKEYFNKMLFFKDIARKPVESFILFRGKNREMSDGILALSFTDFFEQLENTIS